MNCPLLMMRRRIEANLSVERIAGQPKTDRPKPDRSKLDRPKLDRPQKDRNEQMEYAMPVDFCQEFVDHLDDFYTLSLLLTADRQKAEQCFISGLEDCLRGTPVFREWARSWAKRTVIKNAIRSISPLRTETASESEKPVLDGDTPAAAIMTLPPLDRFVYVMSVLGKYSDRECSILLDCTVKKVADARIRALQRLVNMGSPKTSVETPLTQGAA